MASLIMHQVVGENYCKKYSVTNINTLLEGNIAPDILPDKEERHYTVNKPLVTFRDGILDRVNLHKFAITNKLDNDYNIGYFLHLVADYIFYNNLVINSGKFENILNSPYSQSEKIMYNEYDRVANLLLNIYPLTDTTKLPSQALGKLNEELQVFEANDIIRFIDICYGLDLQTIYLEAQNNNYTTLDSFKF